MKQIVLILSLACSFAPCAQSSIPMAPVPQASSAAAQDSPPEPDGQATPITRGDAERMALKNNPRVTASHLLALAAGQVTRETRSNELPQINGNTTAVKAEDGSRIGSGELNSSRLYTHAGTGGTLSQLLTDFGHTRNLVANSRLQAKAQQQNALATEQDVLIATDQAFYRLLDAQSLLDIATATVKARGDVQNLTMALTKSALKSDLDLNISSADLSQAQLLELDAENSVASARAALAELLAAAPETQYRAVDDGSTAPPLPPDDSSALIKEAQAQRPDLQALRLDTQADQKFARAQELQRLPSISALAMGGVTPIRPDGGIFTTNWYAAAGVNLTLPVFTGFRINAQAKEARLRERASEKQAQELSDAIARDVRIATLSAQTAFRRIGVAEAFQSQTAQALNLAKTRYKLGLSSIVELSQAQLQSTQATVEAVNARFDYLLALRSLDYARGQLAP
jgi:outer membrane protein